MGKRICRAIIVGHRIGVQIFLQGIDTGAKRGHFRCRPRIEHGRHLAGHGGVADREVHTVAAQLPQPGVDPEETEGRRIEDSRDPATGLPVQIYMWASSAERGFVERTAGATMVLLAFLIAFLARLRCLLS